VDAVRRQPVLNQRCARRVNGVTRSHSHVYHVYSRLRLGMDRIYDLGRQPQPSAWGCRNETAGVAKQ
jgi:hypothetical protein